MAQLLLRLGLMGLTLAGLLGLAGRFDIGLGRIGTAAILSGGQATLSTPEPVGGGSGRGDARDADFYPVLAHDPVSQRYLAVWMSPRNALSPTDGLDVYGIILDWNGHPTGSEFRISDSNTAARNGPPAVAAGLNGFVVAWTAQGAPCRIYAQRVLDTKGQGDHLLSQGSVHHHSPRLVYDAGRQRFILVYVAGDDYLPPTSLGVDTTGCGDDGAGDSRIEALTFTLSDTAPVADPAVTVSQGSGGAFRPAVAYAPALDQALVAWEDRRNSEGGSYRFDVYGRRLDSALDPVGDDFPLSSGGDYTPENTTTTWTARPALAAGDTGFLAAWFEREQADAGTVWTIRARAIPAAADPGPPFTVAEAAFSQPHPHAPPTGFLATAYNSALQEYLVATTTHLESFWGYFSTARIQRLDADGRLLKLDGSEQDSPAVGYAVDYAIEDQVGVALASSHAITDGHTGFVVGYSKHTPGQHPQDLDIWGVQVRIPAGNATATPTATSTPVGSNTFTPTSTPTPVAGDTPTPTATSTANPDETPTPTATQTPSGTPEMDSTPTATATFTATPTETTGPESPDPTATPTPTATNPVPSGVSTIIVPESGGSITVASTLTATVSFPPGAVSQAVTVTIGEALDPPATTGFRLLGRVFTVAAYAPDAAPVTVFHLPLAMTVHYNSADVIGMEEQALTLFHWDPTLERWVAIVTEVDPTANRLTAVLDHLGTFAVLVQVAEQIYLPTVQR